MTDPCTELLAQAEAFLASRNLPRAVACFEQASQLGADTDRCAGRLWTCHMLAGNYELAWQQSDALRARGAPDEHRVWDGTSLSGRSIMVRSVHGFGDAVQMLRYAPMIRREAARLTVQLAPQLVDLARSIPQIDEVIAWGEERPYQTQIEITELPYIFRSTLETLPRELPYLQLAPKIEAGSGGILGARTRPRIGLVWSSSAWDTSRSIPFQQLSPILERHEDLEFWCLQPYTAEWIGFSRQKGWPLRTAGNHSALFFASCLGELNLLITTDTFAAHLAGALGVPAWVLLKQQADWRWLTLREDSPWYPTLRLFRQSVQGNWEQVIAEVAHALSICQPVIF